jgi:DNA transposition AAA+ family ATPase
VESLAKTLDGELDGDQNARERRIEATLERWLDEDLIELATDS